MHRRCYQQDGPDKPPVLLASSGFLFFIEANIIPPRKFCIYVKGKSSNYILNMLYFDV